MIAEALAPGGRGGGRPILTMFQAVTTGIRGSWSVSALPVLNVNDEIPGNRRSSGVRSPAGPVLEDTRIQSRSIDLTKATDLKDFRSWPHGARVRSSGTLVHSLLSLI